MEFPSCTLNSSGSLDQYEVLEQVGHGTYGRVFKARPKSKAGPSLVALKVIPVQVSSSPKGSPTLGSSVGAPVDGVTFTAIREIKNLLQLERCKNVVKILDSFLTKVNELVIVLEYHEFDLVGLLSCTPSELPVAHVRWYLRQAVEAVHQCHANGLMHRDVKAANMLVNRDGELRLADFGLMTTFDDPNVQHSANVVTLWYRAPEILLGDSLYGPAVDMWALGCLMVELFTKSSPFPGQNDANQLELILMTCGTPTEDTYPGIRRTPGYQKLVSKWPAHPPTLLDRFRNFPPEALDLLSGLLALDPRRRLRAQEVLRHPFFAGTPVNAPHLPSRVESLHEFELRVKRKLTSDSSAPTANGKAAALSLGEKKLRLEGASPSVQVARKPPASLSSPPARSSSAAGSSPPNPLTTSTFSPGPSPAGRRPSPPGSHYAAVAPLPVPSIHIRNPYLLPPRKRADASV